MTKWIEIKIRKGKTLKGHGRTRAAFEESLGFLKWVEQALESLASGEWVQVWAFPVPFECLNQITPSCSSNAFMSAFVLRNIFEKMDLAFEGGQMFLWMCLTPSIGKLEVGFDHQLWYNTSHTPDREGLCPRFYVNEMSIQQVRQQSERWARHYSRQGPPLPSEEKGNQLREGLIQPSKMTWNYCLTQAFVDDFDQGIWRQFEAWSTTKYRTMLNLKLNPVFKFFLPNKLQASESFST